MKRKDISFFLNLDPQLPAPSSEDLPATARAFGQAVHQAAGARRELGTERGSRLMEVLDYETMNTRLGLLGAQAYRLTRELPEDFDFLAALFELTNELLAEAREIGIPSDELPRLQALGLFCVDRAFGLISEGASVVATDPRDPSILTRNDLDDDR